MKIKKILMDTNISKIWIVFVVLASLIMIGTYFSYAMFTVSAEKKDALSIATGNLTAFMTITGYSATTIPAGTRSVTIPANSTKTVLVTIESNNSISARFNFYYVGTLASGVTVGYTDATGYNTPPAATGTTLNAKGSTGSSVIYQVVLKNTTTSSQTVTFGAQMGLSYNNLSLPSNGHLLSKYNFDTLLERLVAISSESTDYSSSTDGEKQQPYQMRLTPLTGSQTQLDTWDADDLKIYYFLGSNPSNYITYDDETWRILGVYTAEDTDGNKDQYIKLVKNTSKYTRSFDGDSNNDWPSSDLCNDWNVNDVPTLKGEAWGMASFVKWYLGGNNSTNGGGALTAFQKETGKTVASGHSTYWNGKVGLIYPSDYFRTYRYVYDSCFRSGTCTGAERTNSWLYRSGVNWWTISPNTGSSDVFAILSDGSVLNRSSSFYSYYAVPTVYLSGDLKYAGGTGTSSNPYRVEANSVVALTSSGEKTTLKFQDGTEVKEGARFKLVPREDSGYAVDVAGGALSDGTNIQIWHKISDSYAQQLTAYRAGGPSNSTYSSYYYITTFDAVSYNLDIYGASTANQTNIQLYTRNYSLAQRFSFVESDEEGYYYLRSAIGTCMDLNKNGGSSVVDGQNIQSYECNYTNPQKWALIPG